ncbi:unnamed protein product [Boreogadus saida]
MPLQSLLANPQGAHCTSVTVYRICEPPLCLHSTHVSCVTVAGPGGVPQAMTARGVVSTQVQGPASRGMGVCTYGKRGRKQDSHRLDSDGQTGRPPGWLPYPLSNSETPQSSMTSVVTDKQ